MTRMGRNRGRCALQKRLIARLRLFHRQGLSQRRPHFIARIALGDQGPDSRVQASNVEPRILKRLPRRTIANFDQCRAFFRIEVGIGLCDS